MTSKAKRPAWSKDQIRAARRVPLPPLLAHRGFRLRETGAGNFEVCDYPGLIVKDCFWRWPDQDADGNTIDFFVHVLGMSFAAAMQTLMENPEAPSVS
ncbi:MAG: hypothetical protein OES34_12505 [Nitrosopumilus sp.]|nr:hypothetical protein [Nitrosopumilus sp.]